MCYLCRAQLADLGPDYSEDDVMPSNPIIFKAIDDLKAGRKLYFSYEVCKEMQLALSHYISGVTVGFESSRNHHSPYLTIRD